MTHSRDTAINNNVRPPTAKKIQAHFVISEEVWRRFRAKLASLGYSSASSFFQEKIREVLREDIP